MDGNWRILWFFELALGVISAQAAESTKSIGDVDSSETATLVFIQGEPSTEDHVIGRAGGVDSSDLCESLCEQNGACESFRWRRDDSSCLLIDSGVDEARYVKSPHAFWLVKGYSKRPGDFRHKRYLSEANRYGEGVPEMVSTGPNHTTTTAAPETTTAAPETAPVDPETTTAAKETTTAAKETTTAALETKATTTEPVSHGGGLDSPNDNQYYQYNGGNYSKSVWRLVSDLGADCEGMGHLICTGTEQDRSWEEAKAECGRRDRRAMLPEPKNRTALACITEKLVLVHNDKLWLGFNYISEEGLWRNQAGDDVTHMIRDNWEQNQPKKDYESCLYGQGNVGLKVHQCSNKIDSKLVCIVA